MEKTNTDKATSDDQISTWKIHPTQKITPGILEETKNCLIRIYL
jgi:hypothetical protein